MRRKSYFITTTLRRRPNNRKNKKFELGQPPMLQNNDNIVNSAAPERTQPVRRATLRSRFVK
jgi:hypothetical protein